MAWCQPMPQLKSIGMKETEVQLCIVVAFMFCCASRRCVPVKPMLKHLTSVHRDLQSVITTNSRPNTIHACLIMKGSCQEQSLVG
jgi:hypothetical protein